MNRIEEKTGVDVQQVRRSFARAAESYENHAQIQDYAAARLAESFFGVCGRQPLERVLEVGAGSGLLTRRIAPGVPGAVYTANDITDSFVRQYVLWGCEALIGDAQAVEFPADQDAVLSSSCLQWIRDVPAFFRKVNACLRPGGLLCFSTFGPDNFFQVRHLTGIGLDYYPLEKWTAMLRVAGFDVREAFCERDTLHFETAREMFRYFSATGVNGLGNAGGMWTPRRLSDFERRYRALYASGGQPLPLTVDYVWVSAEKMG